MKLTDREVLELNRLCSAVVDGTLGEADRARLQAWLRESEAARRYYVRAVGQSASLYGYAAEMHAEVPDRRPRGRSRAPVVSWTLVALATAAAALLLLRQPAPPIVAPGPALLGGNSVVATITAESDARWDGPAPQLTPGAHLRKGQLLNLRDGFAEITFDSGARVILQGNASLQVNSAWDATLRRGALKATVPPEAVGFRVANRAVEVVDLGTEFTMVADATDSADVLVQKGEVEAAPSAAPEDETVLLRARQARRFDANGVTAVSDAGQQFSAFEHPVPLRRYAPPLGYVHWSFNLAGGEVAPPEVHGLPITPADARLRVFDLTDGSDLHRRGHEGAGLSFDGHAYASAHVAGISGDSPRTVAFWVRVPDDAQPIDTWMVAWGTTAPKLGGRPVQISWNRRPAEGALGALRTDFGGGYAIGTTSLRDGKWHHIAVYFAPGDSDDPAPQVKQYVDGHLESSTIVPGAIRAPAGTGDMAIHDVVWLGYRLTGKQEGRRFRGDIDELFIADRGLQPAEIVSLMHDNRPDRPLLARNP